MESSSNPTEQKKKRKKFHFKEPSGITIVIIVLLIACALTYLIPAGQFVKETDAEGHEVVVRDNYEQITQNPVSPLSLPVLVIDSVQSVSEVILIYFTSGGAIYIIVKSGAISALISMSIARLARHRRFFLILLTLLFAVLSIVIMPQAFIAFAPVMVILARSLGYDSIVGVAVILLGNAIGYSCGAFGTSTVVAQSLVDLPILSGWEFRLICMAVLLVPTIWYLIHYAEKVRKNPEKSVVYALEQRHREQRKMCGEEQKLEKLTPQMIATLLVFLATMVIIVYGTMTFDWYLGEYSAVFVVLALVEGLINGMGFSRTSDEFVNGAKGLMGPAIISALARAVAVVLINGQIIDSIVYGLTGPMLALPSWLLGPAMFLMQLIINCAIVSGGGQAMVTMPIMGSVAQILHMPMQSAVLAFNLGDGLGNYVLPHSAQLVGFTEEVDISFGGWMRFMGKLFGIWFLMSCVMMSISTVAWG